MPTTHPFSSPQMNSLVRWVLAAMLVMIGAGCQTEPEEPKGPQTYTAEFTITESHKIPTAVKWSTDNDSAEAPLVSSGTNEYRIGIPLASPPNTPVKVDLYRAGLLYYRLKFDYTGTTALTLNSGALAPNDVAIELLKRLGDKATDSSVAAEVARALLDNDTLVKSDLILSGKLPGLDTAKVVQEALKLLVAKNMPLKELVPSGKWILDIDTLSIHVRMRDLSLSGTIVADTNKLFPPYPVRVKQALAISGELLAGGGALAVSGVFEATNKLVTSSVKVFRDNDDATNGFEFPVNFDLIDRPSKLDLSGKLSIAAKPTTAPGTYRLEILLQDQDAFFAKATLEFQVVSQPTDTGAPVISREPGTNDSTVAYSVTSLTLAWKITGASRVTFNGSTVAAGDGIYTIPASSLKVGANGFKIVATNPAGKESSDTITIWRAYHDSIFPVAVRESGTKDTTVPHATESIVLSWRVTDNDTLQSVSIGGLVAAAVGDIYSATLPLKPGGNLFILAATDTARNATRDTVTVFRTLDVGAPVIERQAGTKDSSVSYATTGIQLSWKVTDDVGVSSVEINGSVVTGSDGIYSLEATNLAIGKNGFRIEAKDAGGKSSFDTLTIVRAWKDTIAPSIVRQTGTGPKTVVHKDSSFSPAWSITDNHKIDSVLFQGVRVAIGANGVFSATA
ncbi:MAG TPA: hypothetical protein PK208_16900, partial [Fibrobacteria bacterium]|nr:hypothetical protein [Fibrobacteria bacterium]